MALGIQAGGGSGEIKPFIKYDARAGRMFRADRSQNGSGQWESNDVDITNACSFVADLGNIRVGWVNYTPQGPVRRFVILGREAIPPRPEDKGADGKPLFKQGFEMTVALSKDAGGGVRDFGSSAGCVIEAVDGIHDAYLAAPEAASGKLPVIKMANTVAVKSGQSTNYKPVFQITGWVDRPASLPIPASEAAPAPQGAPAAPTPPATGSTPAAPPAPQQAPQPAMASSDDFG